MPIQQPSCSVLGSLFRSVVHKITLQVRSMGSLAQVFTLRDRYMVSDARSITLQDRPSGTDAHVTVPRSA